MKVSRRQKGGYVAQNDHTRVVFPIIREKIRLTPEQIRNNRLQKRKQAYIYDTNKANYYNNLQNFYNYNAFGYGLQGNQTRFDPSTPEGQQSISNSFDYSKNNAMDFMSNISGAGVGSVMSKVGQYASKIYSNLTKGVFKIPSSNGALGTLKQYSKKPIGGGAESVVIDNTPTTVGKMSSIPVEEMMAKNKIPNVVPSRYIGYVKSNKVKLPTYIQRKVKTITDETFPKYLKMLDRSMQKHGFRIVNDPQVQYRAYTNGRVVIDDIAPDNIGLTSGNSWLDKILPDFLKKPQIIDMNYQTVPEWLELGFVLKNGGKL